MASKRKMSRRPRKRAHTRRKRRIIRKKKLRSVKRYRHQKRSARTKSRLAKRLPKRLPKRLSKRLPKRVPTKKVQMTRDAWGMLHSYVDGIYGKVSGEAERRRKKDRRPSVTSSDVQSALRQIIPKKESRRSTRIR